jgi:hypothetical protein
VSVMFSSIVVQGGIGCTGAQLTGWLVRRCPERESCRAVRPVEARIGLDPRIP